MYWITTAIVIFKNNQQGSIGWGWSMKFMFQANYLHFIFINNDVIYWERWWEKFLEMEIIKIIE